MNICSYQPTHIWDERGINARFKFLFDYMCHFKGGGGSGNPSAPNQSVQFNNSGSFGGSSSFTWNGTSLVLNGYTFPTSNGSLNQVLTNDGSGNLYWGSSPSAPPQTWQGTLITSSTLTQPNTVDGGAFDFIFGNTGRVQFNVNNEFHVTDFATNDSLFVIGSNFAQFWVLNGGNQFTTFFIDGQGAYNHASNDGTATNTIFEQFADGSLNTYVWNNSNIFQSFGVDNLGGFNFYVNDGNTQYKVLSVNTGTGGIRFFDTYEFPIVDGSSGQVLTTDGSGNVNWTDVTGVNIYNTDGTLTGNRTLDGGVGYNLSLSNLGTYTLGTNSIITINAGDDFTINGSGGFIVNSTSAGFTTPGGFTVDCTTSNDAAFTSRIFQVIASSQIQLSAPTITMSSVPNITGGASGTFTTVDLKTVTVTNGIITSIV